MKILSVHLKDYKPFQFSHIEELELHPHSPCQIIIGANGSGKSSLLKEISLKPPSRSDYGENGFKEIVVEYLGNKYNLISDFSKRSSPHVFLQNGENLNISGGTHVQEDLILEHLKFSKKHDILLRNLYDFVLAPPSLRKTYFSDLSPFNLGFLLSHHKTVSSKIRQHKATLAHLESRKAILEQDLLKDDDIQILVEERKKRELDISRSLEYIYRIEEIIRQIRDEPCVSLNDIKSSLKSLEMPNLDNINQHDPEQQQKNLEMKYLQIEDRIKHLDNDIYKDLEDIDLYKSDAEKLKGLKSKSLIEMDIRKLKKELKNLDVDISHTFEDYLLETFQSLLDEMIKASHELISAPVLFDRDTFQKKKEDLYLKEMSFDNLQRKKKEIEETLSSLTTSIKRQDLPKQNCAEALCPLWRAFMETYTTREQKKRALNKSLSLTNKEIRKHEKYINDIKEQLDQFQPFIPILKTVLETLSQYPQLKLSLKDEDIFDQLKRNPLQLMNKIQHHLNLSFQLRERNKCLKELEKKKEELEHIKVLKSGEREFIASLIKKHEKDLNQKRKEKETLLKEKEDIENSLKDLEIYIDLQMSFLEIYENFKTTSKTLPRVYEKKFLEEVKTKLVHLKDEAVSRLGEIDHLKNTQDVLRGRYQEEVISQISVKSSVKSELEQIEKALSPSSGIPHRYMISFLNLVIDKVNYLISQVFTYRCELHLLKETEPLEYKFPFSVDDVDMEDISSGSDAQKEIINLSFSLALMEILNLKDMPLILDEIGKSFDHRHRQNLLYLFKDRLESDLISTLFLVNHNETVLGGLDADITVLNPMNIILPEFYNRHTKIIHV